jgi:hypothetical protein
MFIRFSYGVVLTVCNHNWDTGEDTACPRKFGCGEIYEVGEVSPVDEKMDVLEILGVGFCEVPRNAWTQNVVRFSFFPDAIPLN